MTWIGWQKGPAFASDDRLHRLWTVTQLLALHPLPRPQPRQGTSRRRRLWDLIQVIMLAWGFLKERLELPRPPLGYGQHNTASLVCGFLETHPALQGGC